MSFAAQQPKINRESIETWRKTMTCDPVAVNPTVVFSIPLIARHRARDWSQVCENLGQTIETLRRQTNPNWMAVVCGQTQPDGIDFDDQVIFLRFTKPAPGIDKGEKRRSITEFCSQILSGDAYLFCLDADDLTHPKLVDYMVETRDPSGYLIDKGFMYNTTTGETAPLHRADKDAIRKQEGPFGFALVPRRLDNVFRKLTGRGFANFPPRLSKLKSFDSTCGSCVAWRCQFGQTKLDVPVLPELSHRLIGLSNRNDLMQLNYVPFHAMMYVIGHGENLQEAKGRLRYKTRYIDEFKMTQRDTQQALAEFGIREERGATGNL